MMRALAAAELLAAWERGLRQTPLQRALTLLAAAWPDLSPEALARLRLGQRDERLLTLREQTFGPRLAGLAACPTCGERVEIAFDVADIRVETEPASEMDFSFTQAGHAVRFRLPNSLDLAAVANSPEAAAARRLLLERCVVDIRAGGEVVPVEQLPPELEAALVERLAQADPQADVQLALACPACRHQWQAIFDIATFFWIELNAWAYRLLDEVHRLASAYGWSEAEILALSAQRRQFYLERLSR